MFASTLLATVFTVVFVVSGGYSLVRLARLVAGDGAPGDRLVELFHLVMSIAMVAMTWAWTGGPATAGGVVQLVVFGAFALWFAFRASGRACAHGRLANAYHLVMAAAMVWMGAAMPLLMGMSGDADGADGGHAGHHGSSGASAMTGTAAMTMPAPGWVTGASVAFTALSLVSAGWWLSRLVGDETPARDVLPDGDVLVGVATRVRPTRGVRADAACHLLMSLGMAGMLLAML